MLSGDVKIRLWQTSRDERTQALWANFVLQATNAQGLGTRLVVARVGRILFECHYVRTEKQARTAAYILTRNVRIQYSPQFERGLESEPKKDTSTHKCMLEN